MRPVTVGVALALATGCVVAPAAPTPRVASYPTLQKDDDPIDPYVGAAGEPIGDPAAPALSTWQDGEIQPVIPVAVDIGDPRVVQAMVVRLRAKFFHVPAAPNQDVDLGDDGVQRVTVRVADGAEVTAAERKAALKPTATIDADHELIRDIARTAIERERDPRIQVERLVEWIDTHITYEITDEVVASSVVVNGKGDCAEQSLLFIALARAIKLPARQVVGLVPTQTPAGGAAFGYHAWAEVAIDGHWIQVDPTWNEPVADATHITLGVGDNEPTADELDGLSLAVGELTRGSGGEYDARKLARDLPVHLQLHRH